MIPSRWTNELSTGNPAIDRDHQELIGIIDLLKEAASAGDQKAQLAHALDQFRSHVLDHFPAEEREMEAKGFPGLAKHRNAHAFLTEQVLALVQKDNNGETVLYTEVDQLAQSLYRHIIIDDKPFALFLAKG
ncbi:MAG: bacteriohemerythrin [Planctomycetota bacterium]